MAFNTLLTIYSTLRVTLHPLCFYISWYYHGQYDSLISFKSNSCWRRMAFHLININKLLMLIRWLLTITFFHICQLLLKSPTRTNVFSENVTQFLKRSSICYRPSLLFAKCNYYILCGIAWLPVSSMEHLHCWKIFNNEEQPPGLFKNTFFYLPNYDGTTDTIRHDANPNSEEDYEKPFVQSMERPVTTAPPRPKFRLFRSIYVNIMMYSRCHSG